MYTVLFLAISLLVFILYVHYENLNLEVTHYSISSEKIPSGFEGVKLIIIADLHNNSFGKNNSELLNQINEIKPDFILIAGDLIIGRKNNDYSIAETLLTSLAGRYPIYYGYGNHEQRVCNSGISYDKLFDEYKSRLQNVGVHFLSNDKTILSHQGDTITLTGLQIDMEYFNKLKQPVMEPQYLQNLVGIPDNQCYNIMIAHNPVYLKNYAEWGADLVVSGHLHGGMIRLPLLGGVVSPQYKLLPRYDAGEFEMYQSRMLVSRGLGTHTIKIRVCNRPELMVITLKRK